MNNINSQGYFLNVLINKSAIVYSSLLSFIFTYLHMTVSVEYGSAPDWIYFEPLHLHTAAL